MFNDHRLMSPWRVSGLPFLIYLVLGCTKPNPLNCADGTCTDPAYPFCDLDGSFEGQPNQCVAVECTPMDFVACRGDDELRCNAVGTDYDVTKCQLGCEAGGCRLCAPSETACTNGTLATCDAAGTVVTSEACPLGCFEDEPRCREIDPSNGFGQYLGMVPEPQDLDLEGAVIDTSTGIIDGTSTVPSFLLAAPFDGVAVRVFVVRNLRLGSATVVANPLVAQPALAFVASGDIRVEGMIELNDYEAYPPGGVVNGACLGGAGQGGTSANGQQKVYTGGGGGGNATAGAPGGDINFEIGRTGGVGGAVAGTESLSPLRGGCGAYAPGGGAIQLSSRKSIVVTGTLNVSGGTGAPSAESAPGGGAGGGILLEAPLVELGPSAKLIAMGGNGGTNCNPTKCGWHRGVAGNPSYRGSQRSVHEQHHPLAILFGRGRRRARPGPYQHTRWLLHEGEHHG